MCRGLKFCVPRKPSQVEVDAQFESFYRQLPIDHSNPSSDLVKLKSDLVSASKTFSSARLPPSILGKDHISALRSLKTDDSVVITRPDKGDGVVVLDRSDYVSRVSHVLSDNSKFCFDDTQTDSTSQLQKDVIQHLDYLAHQGIISQNKALRPRSCQVPKLYGLPKIHKPNFSVRPILSMCSSPTYYLAKWLCDILQPVREAVSTHNLKDSFAFVDLLSESRLDDTITASLDVSSLFTNVPLCETISIIQTVIDDKQLDINCPFDRLESLLLL